MKRKQEVRSSGIEEILMLTNPKVAEVIPMVLALWLVLISLSQPSGAGGEDERGKTIYRFTAH